MHRYVDNLNKIFGFMFFNLVIYNVDALSRSFSMRHVVKFQLTVDRVANIKGKMVLMSKNGS